MYNINKLNKWLDILHVEEIVIFAIIKFVRELLHKHPKIVLSSYAEPKVMNLMT